LLHVVDAHSEERDEIMAQVNHVLVDIKADKIPQLEVFNKIDLLDTKVSPHIDRDEYGKPIRVWLSAATGAGVDLLHQALTELFATTQVSRRCFLTPAQADIRAKLFVCAKIIDEQIDDFGGYDLVVKLDAKHLGLLKGVHTEDVV
jgi:GTP-binding protein HflX